MTTSSDVVPAARHWRCAVGLHPWSRWSAPHRATGHRIECWSIGAATERERVAVIVVAQDRTCLGCGLWQQRFTEVARPAQLAGMEP